MRPGKLVVGDVWESAIPGGGYHLPLSPGSEPSGAADGGLGIRSNRRMLVRRGQITVLRDPTDETIVPCPRVHARPRIPLGRRSIHRR